MGNTLPIGMEKPPGVKFFTISIFTQNTSKHTKLMVEPFIYDNLNQIYRFFSFLTKNFEIHLVLENCLGGNRLIYFIHL